LPVDRGKIAERPIQAVGAGFLIQIKVDAKDFRGASFTVVAFGTYVPSPSPCRCLMPTNSLRCDKSSILLDFAAY
jgi:hypothetical protein